MRKILMFSGSNNPRSINQVMINAIADMIPTDKRTVINLRDYQMPVYSFEIEAAGIPEEAKALRKIIDEYDMLVISVPEHNGSISAFFKNAMDWLSRVDVGYKIFTNKKIVLLSVSPVGGGANASDHAEAILKRLGGTITEKIAISKFFEKALSTEDGLQFKDEELEARIKGIAKNISELEYQTEII